MTSRATFTQAEQIRTLRVASVSTINRLRNANREGRSFLLQNEQRSDPSPSCPALGSARDKHASQIARPRGPGTRSCAPLPQNVQFMTDALRPQSAVSYQAPSRRSHNPVQAYCQNVPQPELLK